MGDQWLSGVAEIKEEVRRHFSSQFKEEKSVRPTLDGVQFKSISSLESERLIEDFTMEEVKEAVWSCEGDKSSGAGWIQFHLHANGKVLLGYYKGGDFWGFG